MAHAVHVSLGRVFRLAQVAQQGGLDWLSPAEVARLGRITAPSRHAQFIAGRWLARQLLTQLHGGEPQAWRISAPDSGPPAITGPAAPDSIHLSLTHSADSVGCAIGSCPLGLDLEVPRRTRDFLALADVMCSAAERERLRREPASSREALFYELWTLKEAWIKSRGQDVSPGRLAQIHTSAATSASAYRGRLWQGEGLTLALVTLPHCPVHWVGGAPGEPAERAIVDTASGGA